MEVKLNFIERIIMTLRTVVGGGISFTFKALNGILKSFDMNILDLTANIGDAVVAFRSFLFSNNLINQGFRLLGEGVKILVDSFVKLIDIIKDLPIVQDALERISKIDLSNIHITDIGKNLYDTISSLDLFQTGVNIVTSLKNGLGSGIETIPEILISVGNGILNAIKGVLGIHSPSTEMFEVGRNAILGLINGIKEETGKVVDSIKDVGSQLLSASKDVDWGKVLAVTGLASTVASVVYCIKKITDTVDKVTSPLQSASKLLDKFGEVLDAFKSNLEKSMKAMTFKTKTEGIKNLAISIGILAASMYVLAQLNRDQLIQAGAAIVVLAGVVAGLAIAMSKLESASVEVDAAQKKMNLTGLKSGIIGIGVALLAIAGAIKIIGGMNPDQFVQGLEGLGAAVAAMAAIFLAFGLFVRGDAAKNMDKAGVMMKKMATAMLLMAIVVKIVGGLSIESMIKGAAFITAFVIFATLLGAASKISGSEMSKLGSMMMKMSIAMGLMVGVVKLTGMLSAEEMLKGVAFGTGFILFVALMKKAVSMNGSTQMAKLSGLLLSLTVSMGLMVGVVKLVGMLSSGEMRKGAVFAAGFLIFTAALTAIARIGGSGTMAKLGVMMMSMSVALTLMVGVMKLVGLLRISEIIKGGLAITAFTAMMVAMIEAIKMVGPDAPNMSKTLLIMSVAIGILAGICVLMSLMDIQSLAKGIAAVGMISIFMALMIAATKGATQCVVNIITMTAAVAAIAGILYLMQDMPIKSTLGNALALSEVMLALASATKIMSSVGKIGAKAIASLAVMTAVLTAVALILGYLNQNNMNAATGSATALAAVMISLAASTKIISTISSVSSGAMSAVAQMTIVLAAVGTILGILNKFDLHASMSDVLLLSTMLIAISTSALILSKVGPTASAAASGAAKLLAVIGVTALVFGAVGGIVAAIPGGRKFVEEGIPVLEALGKGIGSFFGGIVGGFMAGATSGLPDIANNLKAFIDTFSGVDSSALTGVKTMSDAILEITTSGIISKISEFVNGGQDPIEKFGEQIKKLGSVMKDVASTIDGMSALDTVNLLNLANVGKIFADLQSTIAPVAGILQGITGVKDLGDFGTQISNYADSLSTAIDSIADINTTGLENLKSIAKVGKVFSALQETISPIKGLMPLINGVKDLGNFGSQIEKYAKVLDKAAKAVANISVTGLDNLETIAKLGKAFTKLQDTVDPCKGLIQKISGYADIGTFGSQIKQYVQSINEAAKAVANISVTGIGNLEKLPDIGKAFDKLTEIVPKTGGLAQKLSGQVYIGEFGENISKFADGLKTAADAMTGDNAVTGEAINAAINDGKLLAELQKALPESRHLVCWLIFNRNEKTVYLFPSLQCYYGSFQS